MIQLHTYCRSRAKKKKNNTTNRASLGISVTAEHLGGGGSSNLAKVLAIRNLIQQALCLLPTALLYKGGQDRGGDVCTKHNAENVAGSKTEMWHL